MGIKGLWDLLRPLGHPIDLESLRGKVLAVDISFWLHHAKYFGEVKGISERKAAIELVYRRVLKLLHFGIRPVFVFDGPEASIFKLPVLNERRKQREHQANEKAKRSQNSALKTLARKALAIQLAREEGKRRKVDSETVVSSEEPGVNDEAGGSCSQADGSDTVEEMEDSEDWTELDRLVGRVDGTEPVSVDVVFGGADHAHVLIRSDPSTQPTTKGRGGFCEEDERKRRRAAVERIRRLTTLEHIRELRHNQQKRCDSLTNQLLVYEDEKQLVSSDDEEFEEVPDVDAVALSESYVKTGKEQSRSPSPEIVERRCSEEPPKQEVEKWPARKEENGEGSGMVRGGEIAERCRELLTYFGVPFVDSPGEAEAQCVSLEQCGLTDGTMTDDSDAWAFGGRVVYRHVFERKKSAEEYRAEDALEAFGLGQLHFIAVALLIGCDFTPGVVNVGMVSALEIISTFLTTGRMKSESDAISKLAKFRRWWEKNHIEDGKPEAPETNPVKRRLRGLNCIFSSSFPDRRVFELFTQPKVNEVRQSERVPTFQWSTPDMGNLRRLLLEEMTDMRKVDAELADLRRRLQPADSNQSRITTFFSNVKRKPAAVEVLEMRASKRMKRACEKLKRASR